MRKILDDRWLAGVDGCRTGWVVAFARAVDSDIRIRIVPRFAEGLAAPGAPSIVAVDIPIGLPERAGPGGTAAENAVRPLLGARQASVFSIPSRGARVWGAASVGGGAALAPAPAAGGGVRPADGNLGVSVEFTSAPRWPPAGASAVPAGLRRRRR